MLFSETHKHEVTFFIDYHVTLGPKNTFTM